jgi:hypothetical protein
VGKEFIFFTSSCQMKLKDTARFRSTNLRKVAAESKVKQVQLGRGADQNSSTRCRVLICL